MLSVPALHRGMLGVACCGCEGADIDEESITSVPPLPVASVGPHARGYEAKALDEGAPPQPPQSDKAWLQDLVKDFARGAVRGVPCVVLDPQTGDRVAATYSIDPSLSQLLLRSTHAGASAATRHIEIAQIADVADPGEVAPHLVLEATATSGMRERLLAIHLNSKQARVKYWNR